MISICEPSSAYTSLRLPDPLTMSDDDRPTPIYSDNDNNNTKITQNSNNNSNSNIIVRRERPSRACTARSAARLYAAAAAEAEVVAAERKQKRKERPPPPPPPAEEESPPPTPPEDRQFSKIVTPLVGEPPVSLLPRFSIRSMWELGSILNFLNVSEMKLKVAVFIGILMFWCVRVNVFVCV